MIEMEQMLNPKKETRGKEIKANMNSYLYNSFPLY
jgi:hypothetical protein